VFSLFLESVEWLVVCLTQSFFLQLMANSFKQNENVAVM